MSRLAVALCVLSAPQGLFALVEADFSEYSIVDLELERTEIEQRLEVLAQYSPRAGVGSIGCRTQIQKESEHSEWMQIDLVEESRVDQIVLVPVLWRDPISGFAADGFPTEFRILLGNQETPEGRVVAEFDGSEGILPRLAPLIISVPAQQVSWMRIEVARLPKWNRTGEYVFQLSEVLLFNGQENVALRQEVSISTETPDMNSWRKVFLTDGAVPYLLNVPREVGTVAATSKLLKQLESPLEIVIDLGQGFPVSELHLHAVEQSDTAPQAFFGDFGIPDRFRLEGASLEDFSDSRELLLVQLGSVFEKNPVMKWAFPPASCQYLRLTIDEPYEFKGLTAAGYRVGFAEIALYADGVNVASGKPVTGNYSMSHSDQSFANYTDGVNLYGLILPPREWLEELAERHEMELRLPQVNAELKRRYARQKAYLQWSLWLVVVLGAGICVVSIYGRMLRIRQEARVRERVAANLHDELGANLHAIGLLGDMARRLSQSPEDMNETLERIRGLTERTGTAAKHCANMIEAVGICEDLEAEMRRDASRLVADLEHEFEIQGADQLKLLKRRIRIDLMLFYKECLINIIRHSGATSALTKLVVDGKGFQLTVDDNGQGYSGELPRALKRRARLMRANMMMGRSDLGGLQIRLVRRNRKFNFL